MAVADAHRLGHLRQVLPDDTVPLRHQKVGAEPLLAGIEGGDRVGMATVLQLAGDLLPHPQDEGQAAQKDLPVALHGHRHAVHLGEGCHSVHGLGLRQQLHVPQDAV